MSSHMYTHGYADDRAREMELAGPRRQMGCFPLGRMISKFIKKCNGRKGRVRREKLDYAMAYPQAQTCYVRPTARAVACTTSAHPPSAHAVPPSLPPQVHGPFGPTAAAPPRAGGGKPRRRKKSKSKRVRFNPAGPVYADGPAPQTIVADGYHQHAPAAGTSGGAAYGGQHLHHQAAAPHAYSPAPHGDGYGCGRYAPSPLTRWEMLGATGAPRRHEYFSSEYRWCYPTPVRDGIYGMATDPNRITAIFSEENPNACTIV